MTSTLGLFNIFKQQEKIGLLEINFKSPKRLTIEDKYGYKALIDEINGTIKFKLRSPVSIKIDPPPNNTDVILWKGVSLPIEKMQDGVYIFNEESNKSTLAGSLKFNKN